MDAIEIIRSFVILFILLPLLSILGAVLSINPILQLMVLMLSGLVVLFVLRGQVTPDYYFPLGVGVIAISLLFHMSLISRYFIGYDVNLEYYAFRLTMDRSCWNTTVTSGLELPIYNAMLSITILPSICSQIMGIDGSWVFKIVYPIIFSLVPVVLYRVYEKQTDKTVGFLSAFLFMSQWTFYNEMIALNRQIIAELIMVLLLLLLVNKRIDRIKKAILLIIFTITLVFSHYSITYLFIAFCFISWFMMREDERLNFFRRLGVLHRSRTNLTGVQIMLITIIALAWYDFISNGAVLIALVRMISDVINGITTSFFSYKGRDPLVLRAIGLIPEISLWREINKVMYYVIQLFIFIGIVRSIRNKGENFDNLFLSSALSSLLILLLSIALPSSHGLLI